MTYTNEELRSALCAARSALEKRRENHFTRWNVEANEVHIISRNDAIRILDEEIRKLKEKTNEV